MLKITFAVPFVHGLQRPRYYNGAIVDTPKNRTRKSRIAIECQRSKGYSRKLKKYCGRVFIQIECSAPLPKTNQKYCDQDEFIIKPDIDNIAKLVLDGLNGIAFKDDAQVIGLHAHKVPRTKNTLEQTTVQITYPDFGETNE